MEPEIDPKLETIIHEELSKLPSQTAPRTLAPRVMAAIRARSALPWWQQTWWHWPLAAKAAFVTLALFIASLVTGGGWLLEDGAGTYAQVLTHWLSALTPVWNALVPGTDELTAWWNNRGQMALLFLLATGFVMYLLCMGVGTAFVRVAMRRC